MIYSTSHTRICMVHDKLRREIHLHAWVCVNACTRAETIKAEKEREVLLDFMFRSCDCVIFIESTDGSIPRPNASLLLFLSNSRALMSASRRLSLCFAYLDVDANSEQLRSIESSMKNQKWILKKIF